MKKIWFIPAVTLAAALVIGLHTYSKITAYTEPVSLETLICPDGHRGFQTGFSFFSDEDGVLHENPTLSMEPVYNETLSLRACFHYEEQGQEIFWETVLSGENQFNSSLYGLLAEEITEAYTGFENTRQVTHWHEPVTSERVASWDETDSQPSSSYARTTLPASSLRLLDPSALIHAFWEEASHVVMEAEPVEFEGKDVYQVKGILPGSSLARVIPGMESVFADVFSSFGAELDYKYIQSETVLYFDASTLEMTAATFSFTHGIPSVLALAQVQVTEMIDFSFTLRLDHNKEEPSLSVPDTLKSLVTEAEQEQSRDDEEYGPKNPIRVNAAFPLYSENDLFAVGINRPANLLTSYEDYYFLSFGNQDHTGQLYYTLKTNQTPDEILSGFQESFVSPLGEEPVISEEKSLTAGDLTVSYRVFDTGSSGQRQLNYLAWSPAGTDQEGNSYTLVCMILNLADENGSFPFRETNIIKAAFTAAVIP